jgi:hypothetical protein
MSAERMPNRFPNIRAQFHCLGRKTSPVSHPKKRPSASLPRAAGGMGQDFYADIAAGAFRPRFVKSLFNA